MQLLWKIKNFLLHSGKKVCNPMEQNECFFV